MPSPHAAIVRQSWAQLAGREVELSEVFYRLLFERAPARAELFAGTDMIGQRLKFAQMLTDIVRYAETHNEIVPDLKALADRHVEYGVAGSDYGVAGAVLLDALGEVLGERFTPEVRTAWAGAYGVAADVMLRRHRSSGGK
jgi:hemoglobin-like flavoprotein